MASVIPVDIIVEFRASPKRPTHKDASTRKQESLKAQLQYSRLLSTLHKSGLKAVGRRGESLGHLLVFVWCPEGVLKGLVARERGNNNSEDLKLKLSPAERVRLVYEFVTSLSADGGLGIAPEAPDWDLVESVFCLHDKEFNKEWIHAWTTTRVSSVSEERVREQFGDSIALYFAFLFSYTRALFIPSIIGVLFYFFSMPYSPSYSLLIALWSVAFVEWWRIRERLLAVRFALAEESAGAAGGLGGWRSAEKSRHEHTPGMKWYQRELRILASVPVVLGFVLVLVAILTGFSCWRVSLQCCIKSFLPTILFAALIPRLQSLFSLTASYLTRWENHKTHSSHTSSLTLKTFVITSLVAYAGLALTAFVYVPFGEGLMKVVQWWLKERAASASASTMGATGTWEQNANANDNESEDATSMWDLSSTNMALKINQGKLQKQLFAYTVTNQIINTFVEVGLPFVMRRVQNMLASKNNGGKDKDKANETEKQSQNQKDQDTTPSDTSTPSTLRKKVAFSDELPPSGSRYPPPAEAALLEQAIFESSLPPYSITSLTPHSLFGDYQEMVLQFGYITLWSSVWPLAPLACLVNNLIEFRGDAVKIAGIGRRPMPTRLATNFKTTGRGAGSGVDNVWLELAGVLSWVGVVVNAALVWLFCPRTDIHVCYRKGGGGVGAAGASAFSAYEKVHRMVLNATSNSSGVPADSSSFFSLSSGAGTTNEVGDAMQRLLLDSLLVALLASHAYFLVRGLVRHLMEKMFWEGSAELNRLEAKELQMRVRGQVEGKGKGKSGSGVQGSEEGVNREEDGEDENEENALLRTRFWENDEGIDEIGRITKEA
ncbi:hypothetical protein D9758_010242 [Tetrapyrgos nigripes]|uniref:DUF590-domain-containing protein n=1 Tax=Tetrapyrgos nigripes TaxID=182062 RepID=A0A8H5D041_9AGAR|nr:hypothetical protein D9758_010242 [Tetrapyrgos nigripes]